MFAGLQGQLWHPLHTCKLAKTLAKQNTQGWLGKRSYNRTGLENAVTLGLG